jgi:hypothetical protein
MKQKAILITGSPHSGTRLVLKMLSNHPDISVPNEILNFVGEFPPLHHYFISSVNHTPLYSADYNHDYEELKFILDSYMLKVDTNKPFVAIKMPFHPLTCLSHFYEYFGEDLQVLFTRRNREKIVTSYWRRAEDKRYFNNPESLKIQVKKLPVNKRKQALVDHDLIFGGIVDESERLKEEWNKKYPEKSIVTLDTKMIASDREEFINILKQLDIEPKNMDEIYKELQKGRLSVGLKTKIKNNIWRTLVKLGYKNR